MILKIDPPQAGLNYSLFIIHLTIFILYSHGRNQTV
jgi:hypothetical protein